MSTAVLSGLTDNSTKDGTGDAINGSEVDANPQTLAKILDGTTATDLAGDDRIDVLFLTGHTTSEEGFRMLCTDAAAGAVRDAITFEWDPSDGSNMTDNTSGIGLTWRFPDDADNQTEFAALDVLVGDDSAAAEDAVMNISLIKGATLTNMVSINADASEWQFDDNIKLTLGTGNDTDISFDGTNTVLAMSAGYLSLTGGDVHVANGQGLVVGHTAQVSVAGSAAEMQVLGTGAADSTMVLGRWSVAGAPAFYFYKSRDTSIGSFTTVANGDTLGILGAVGDDGTDDDTLAGSIAFVVNGTVGTGDLPTDIVFSPADGGTNTEQARIASDGGVTFANLLAAAASTDVNINGSNELHSVTSSIEFKENPRALEVSTAKMKNLAIKTFEWKEGTGSAGETDFGLIAEEVAAVYPELVVYKRDREVQEIDGRSKWVEVGAAKPYAIRTQPLAIMTLKYVQDLEVRVEALEGR